MKCGRVLVADPYARMFEGIRVLLEEIFETIAIVVDGDSFLEVIKELQPELVIMDLSLKDRGGINPFLRFRSLFANIKCIILSVDDDQIFARWAIKNGADGFVLKKNIGDELILAVKKVLKGTRYISPGVCMDYGLRK